MNLAEFDFILPPELIAQQPAARRDQSRLMIVDRARQRITHDVFTNIGHYLHAGDVIVVNDTQVISARLRGQKVRTGGKVEVFLLHERQAGVWEVLLKPAAKTPCGTALTFGDGLLHGYVTERHDTGTAVVQFTPPDIYPLLDRCGEIPLPPYIKRPAVVSRESCDRDRYQTVYARHPGAVAAPTAGLHFTPELLAALERQGVHQAAVTLHVGWGTFQPVRVATVEAHCMSKEFYRLTASQAALITRARAEGGRVVAIGTTTTRTLETIVQRMGACTVDSGWSELFIFPGYRFQAIDALVTNFHLPRSTLFLLVCAFAGHKLMQHAYHVAIAERYRFYSYGDAMLIQ